MAALASARIALSLGLTLGAGALASVGCVTIDDRETVEAGAAGDGQGGGKGGSSAKGGTGGSGGSGTGGSATNGGSSQGGSGGSGTGGSGTGGSGGNAGKGGSSGSSVTCGDEVKPTATRVRTCVYSMSCNPLAPSYTMSDCVTYGYYTSCETTAMSCDDVEHCTGIKREPDSACGADDPNWRCEGDVAIRCGGNSPYSIDCARVADSCDLFESEQDPVRWPCALDSPSSCSPDDSETSECNGTSYYSCIDGTPYGYACGTLGYVCIEGSPGQAQCTDRTVTCDGPAGAVTCEGNSIQVCDTSMRFATYDCTPAGTTCYVEGTSSGYCLSPGCTPESTCEEKCVDDTTMQICVGGAPYLVDCSDYDGFDGCVSYTKHPVTGNDYVECHPAPPALAKHL